ncbi:MAG: hypothetical protein OEV71_10695 [Nitrospira sp.]|nr:hypothetical protein [Nitrospira sp.]MDH5337725.1 hypothetical protein [Nitrospira sp.]
MIGGLMSLTASTLIGLPVLYWWVEDRILRRRAS